jgi:hypothetical protein
MSDDAEARTLGKVGVALTACAVVAAAVVAVANSFRGPANNAVGIVIETPYVGQGVAPGTPLLLHGVAVGEVTQVTSLSGGGVRLGAELRRAPTDGLTDTMAIDFRPANYFGVTGIAVRPMPDGRELVNGSLVRTAPVGDFTLQAMLYRLGELSDGVLTPQLIDVITNVTDYTDSLNPFLETVVTVSTSLANVQTVSTARLLANATGISVVFPSFIDGVIEMGDKYMNSGDMGTATEDWYENTFKVSAELGAVGVWGSIGRLLGSHSTDLVPVTDLIKALADVVPGLVLPDATTDTARQLRLRLERLFAGPPERRAVNVRVILDSLPGMAAPIDAVGGAP